MSEKWWLLEDSSGGWVGLGPFDTRSEAVRWWTGELGEDAVDMIIVHGEVNEKRSVAGRVASMILGKARR